MNDCLYVKHWNELVESGQFEWVEDDEDLSIYCPECGYLKQAHEGDRCPTSDKEAAKKMARPSD